MQQPKYWLHILLFLVTLVTTTAAGAEWIYGRFFIGPQSLGWPEFWAGMNFSIPFLTVLTVHEFGHYFVAKANRVRVSLPYYIPLWLGFGIGESIGTMGAFIRIQDFIKSRQKYFDIGIAGPLAGFVVALALLWYGFSHLPPIDYIFSIHPDYKQFGANYGKHIDEVMAKGNVNANVIAFGDNLLFWFFKNYVADPGLMPHRFEMIHYPYLLAGYLSLFFTSLNLIPIGQLDGGHVLYGLIGRRRFNALAPVLYIGFVFYAGLGLFSVSDFATSDDAVFLDQFSKLIFYVTTLFLMFSRVTEQWITNLLIALSVVAVQFGVSFFFPQVEGYSGFLVFGFVLGRFLGVYHPETEQDEPLSTGRQLLGWLALLVFILCFSPKPFIFS
jgi:membrane-associated protease RseP (regulator of RpoE activity)